MIIKHKFGFYLTIIILHMLFFLKTGKIPTPTEAVILLTIYAVGIASSFSLDKEKEVRE